MQVQFNEESRIGKIALQQTIKKSQQISTGRGTHSEVFRATTSKGMVAVKLIDQRAGGDYIRRFLERELRILIQLKHPRVVNVFAVSQTHFVFQKTFENFRLNGRPSLLPSSKNTHLEETCSTTYEPDQTTT